MRSIAVLATAALVAAVPASLGLIGNAEFSEAVPVRTPETAIILKTRPTTLQPDDRVGDRAPGAARTAPHDDRGGEDRGAAPNGGEDSKQEPAAGEDSRGPGGGSDDRRRTGGVVDDHGHDNGHDN